MKEINEKYQTKKHRLEFDRLKKKNKRQKRRADKEKQVPSLVFLRKEIERESKSFVSRRNT